MDEYSDLAAALAMLDDDCGKLKFEVFMTYSRMIESGRTETYRQTMINAMSEWDI